MVAAIGLAAAAVGAAGGAYAADQSRKAMNHATDAQSSIQQQQLDMAKEQYNHYKSTYEPLEDEFANEAKGYNSEANRQKSAEEAGGDVTANYAQVRQQLNSTPGLDPSSPQYLNTLAKIGVTEAGQKAAAETGARKTVDAMGAAKLQDAISMGKGITSNAESALAGASASASSLGALGVAQGQIAGQQSAGLSRAVTGFLQTPGVGDAMKGWFTSTPSESFTPVPMETTVGGYSGTAADVAATIPNQI